MAWHTNFPIPNSSFRLSSDPDQLEPTLLSSPWNYLKTLFTTYTEAEKKGLVRTKWFMKEGRGYGIEQSTQPQTLGYSLADSPAGLLGWIYEKLVNWTDNYPWSDDEGGYLFSFFGPFFLTDGKIIISKVLTWVSLYWFSTAGPAASLRIYYERAHGPDLTYDAPTIPTGYSYFPQELYNVPRA